MFSGTIHRFSLYPSTGTLSSKNQGAMTCVCKSLMHVRGCDRKLDYLPLPLWHSMDVTGRRLGRKSENLLI